MYRFSKCEITCSENACWDFKFTKIWCSEFCMFHSDSIQLGLLSYSLILTTDISVKHQTECTMASVSSHISIRCPHSHHHKQRSDTLFYKDQFFIFLICRHIVLENYSNIGDALDDGESDSVNTCADSNIPIMFPILSDKKVLFSLSDNFIHPFSLLWALCCFRVTPVPPHNSSMIKSNGWLDESLQWVYVIVENKYNTIPSTVNTCLHPTIIMWISIMTVCASDLPHTPDNKTELTRMNAFLFNFNSHWNIFKAELT